METSLFFDFLLATALGALIGIEREMPAYWAKTGGATGFWGIRSYALLALLGAVTTWMDQSQSSEIWKFLWLIFSSIFVIISYIYSSFKRDKMGVTSEYAALITYIVGVIIMLGYAIIGVVLAIFLLILLTSKEYLARVREKFSREELGNSLKFAVISLVVLPLLPDMKFSILEILNTFANGHFAWTHPILTMKFFNPFGVWLFVVIMAGVEYVWYILSKVLGEHGGIIASGAVGGLISSTATTAAMTHKSLHHPGNRHAYAAAALLASCIMFIRVVAISGFYSPSILGTIIVPASVMFITLGGSVIYLIHRASKERIVQAEEKTTFESPFQLIPAFQFAGMVVAIKFIAGIGLIYKTFIDEHIFYYALGGLSGLADVDAITQDMASKSAEGSLGFLIAATTILIAVMSNNIVKTCIALRWEKIYGRSVLMGFWTSILSGILTIIVMNIVG
jgi:uncharacterized membrane protein (DUF4010 family)